MLSGPPRNGHTGVYMCLLELMGQVGRPWD